MPRRLRHLENEMIRLSVTQEGGHIAELLHKPTALNPLWQPPWPSIEPSTYAPNKHPEYGNDSESKLLSGIQGHNLCLDLFGPPSPAEAGAGLTVHGEASIVPYDISIVDGELTARARLPESRLYFERRLRLAGNRVLIRERVENLDSLDRPIAWQQHVTFGPPFLEAGITQFRAPAKHAGDLGTPADLQTFTATTASNFSTFLLNPSQETSWFLAWSPKFKLMAGYAWNRADFPWLAVWEENCSREHAPWNGRTVARGMEFGTSPFPETRRARIERRNHQGVPAYRWLPARGTLEVSYTAFVGTADSIPETLPA